MRTIYKKLNNGYEVYYGVIEHDLETFKLKILSPWELAAHKDSSSFRVGRGIEIPSYTGSVEVSKKINLSDVDFVIEDKDNLFYRFYTGLSRRGLLNLLDRYKDYKWIFNKESLMLKNDDSEISLLEPISRWNGDKPYSNKISYNPPDNKLFKRIAGSKDYYLINTDFDLYTYSIFRPVWFETVIYTEYIIMQINALNLYGEIFGIDKVLLDTPVVRSEADYIVDDYKEELRSLLLNTNNRKHIYSLLDNYDNVPVANTYKSVLNRLHFTDGCSIDSEYFMKVYEEHLDKYLFAIITYLKWNFIRSNLPISTDDDNCVIKTPLGNLVIRKGEPFWKSLKI